MLYLSIVLNGAYFLTPRNRKKSMIALDIQRTGSGKRKICDTIMYSITLKPAHTNVLILFFSRIIIWLCWLE